MRDWDDLPEVVSPIGRTSADLMATGPRRQDLPGYDPIYRDFVDYILRCTHRIWEEKNVGLCRTHYGEDCVMHTLAGPTQGAETVVQNTIGALAGSSDRRVIAEDVIWSDEGDGNLYSSHRIVSSSTHLGDDSIFGPASSREAGVMTIADCLCRENRIIEEWLVRDNLRAMWQIGADPWVVAKKQAQADREGDQSRHEWRTAEIARVRAGGDVAIADGHPAELPAAMLSAALRGDMYGDAAGALSPAVELRWPGNRHGWGRGFWIGCMTQLRAGLHRPSYTLDHIAARPLPGGEIAVALRWSVAGTHGGGGAWGPASDRDLLLMAVSHYRIRAGAIVEDCT
ncbi:MAG: hypothetical protein ABIU10_05360, partial [Sphingomicrobium sp.]